MYLFVRSLTSDWRAGFVAGALFAFAPYRFHQAPHLQVMWSCWMPFVLYGLRRWFELTDSRPTPGGLPAAHTWRGCWRWTARGAGRAEPVVRLLHDLLRAVRRAVRGVGDGGRGAAWRAFARGWRSALTGVGAAALTVPFMHALLRAARRLGQRPRSSTRWRRSRPTPSAYLTAHGGLRAWGWLQTFPRAEGSLFPGAVPVVRSR